MVAEELEVVEAVVKAVVGGKVEEKVEVVAKVEEMLRMLLHVLERRCVRRTPLGRRRIPQIRGNLLHQGISRFLKNYTGSRHLVPLSLVSLRTVPL